MSETSRINDQIPTDPRTLASLLVLSAAVIHHLTPDQAATITAVFGFATTIAPHLPRGGR